MGYRFQASHANIVAYVTSPTAQHPPRLTSDELYEFLGSLAYQYGDPPIISSFPDWIERVKKAADVGLKFVESRRFGPRARLTPEVINRALSGVRPLMSDYNLFGLTVGTRDQNWELRRFAEYAALSSGHHALFLMPEYSGQEPLSFLDPFPAIAILAEHPKNWPGVLFWSRSGSAAFAPLRDMNELYSRLQQVLDNLRAINTTLDKYQAQSSGKKILHLSDVHFGTDAALENEAYLSAHLQSISKDIGRVVITGDLFNDPKREAALAFRNFRASLSRQRGEDVVVIPGNHDQKWMGNFGSPLGQLANLEWTNLFVDQAMRCVFFCFDSSRDADLARGKITVQQMKEVATEFETKCIALPEIRDYLLVALIHHHPFSFETTKETRVAKALDKLGITDEYFLRMDDADNFLKWCGGKGIRLILHGHKHVARYVKSRITLRDGTGHEITSVGSGTSLGVEGKPLSYNMINWDGSSKSWSVTFFADPGDGSGFAREYVSVQSP